MFENPKNCKMAAEVLRKQADNPKLTPAQRERANKLAHNLEALGRALNKRDWLERLENEPPAGNA